MSAAGGPAWWDDPEQASTLLQSQIETDDLPGTVAIASGRPSWHVALPMPVGPVQELEVLLLRGTLRVTAHDVVTGPLTSLALRNHNLVNEAPWAGRAHPSTDGTGTDLALGLPLPASPEPGQAPRLRDVLGILRSAAVQVRAGRVPRYTGPTAPDPQRALADAAAALRVAGADVKLTADRADLVIDRPRPVAVVIFQVPDGLLAARAVAVDAAAVPGDDALLSRLGQWNRGAAAGAAAWSPSSGLVHGTCALPLALVPVSHHSVQWLVERAAESGQAGAQLATVGAGGLPG